MRSNSSSEVLPNGALSASPALLTRMSTGPKRLTADSNTAGTAEGTVTSSTSTAAMDSRSEIARACASSRSRRRPSNVTPAPARASANADAAPMPLPAPVTAACIPSSALAVVPCTQGLPCWRYFSPKLIYAARVTATSTGQLAQFHKSVSGGVSAQAEIEHREREPGVDRRGGHDGGNQERAVRAHGFGRQEA